MKDYAVCIPTKGRPETLIGLFMKCPTLNSEDTFVGIEPREERLYASWRKKFPKPQIVWVDNPGGYCSAAREPIRKAATDVGYNRYVMSDDDTRFTPASLVTILRAQQAAVEKWTNVVVSGYYSIQGLYHSDTIKYLSTTLDGLTFFPAASWNFWVLPHHFYEQYRYPPDNHLEDIHVVFSAVRYGIGRFFICKEAAFSFERWQEGGAGTVPERVAKIGQSMIRLATDFPEFMTQHIVALRIPYNDVFQQTLSRQKKESRRG